MHDPQLYGLLVPNGLGRARHCHYDPQSSYRGFHNFPKLPKQPILIKVLQQRHPLMVSCNEIKVLHEKFLDMKNRLKINK